jgi:hypothetical protein
MEAELPPFLSEPELPVVKAFLIIQACSHEYQKQYLVVVEDFHPLRS